MTPRAWRLLFSLGALWGAVYLFTKVALEELSPAMVVFTRVALATAILLPPALRHAALRAFRGHERSVLAVALLQATIPLVLLTVGQRSISSSLAGILIATQPIFVALLTVRLDPADRPGTSGLAGIALGIIGVGLLFGIDLQGGATAVLGGLLVLAASCCYGAGAVLLHRRLAHAHPLGVATAAMLITSILLAPAAAVSLPATPPSPATSGALLALGIVCTGLALVLFYTLIMEIGPSRAVLANYLAPGFAILYGAALLGEPLTISSVVGLLLILTGSFLAAARPPRRAPTK